MPNHINNNLSIEGNEKEITEFFKKARSAANGQEFDFEVFLPVPETIKDSWDLIELWGTDRNCYSIKLKMPKEVYFQTAYCFPSGVLIAMSLQFPNLVFTDRWVDEYAESLGIVRWQDGKGELLPEDNQEAKEWRETCQKETDRLA